MTDSEKLDLLLNKVIVIEADVKDVKQEVSEVKQEVTVIKLIIDNELRVDIQRIAEGHLDLSRNLHDAMKPSNEPEMLTVKVNMLETKMEESKSRVS